MKNNLGSTLLFVLSLGGLVVAIAGNPPSGAPWAMFAADPATLVQKAAALVALYVWPGLLACLAISMFQLQFRLAASGANKRTVFAACVLASGAMLMSLRMVSFSPSAGPSYVAGMALGYTVMARLYAVRMRSLVGRVRIPWPVWRGDARSVCEIDQAMQARRQTAS
jgi:hypothetical protein